MEFLGIGIHWWGGVFGLAILLRLWVQLLKWSKWGKDIHKWIDENCKHEVPAPPSGTSFALPPRPPMPTEPGWP